jgi:acyl transferase domain-containing protein/acyl-CoA synthetase (AMP-forming)/AMP-acid ligase II/acyl carrier protein
MPSTLVALLRRRADGEPDRIAYLFLADGEAEAARFTYAQLDQRARAIAARLQADGRAGERALLLYPPGLEFLAAFFGCLYAGVIAVPSYPPKRNRPDRRLQSIAADAGARVVLTDATVLADLGPRLTHTPELAALQWVATDTLPGGAATEWREPAIDASQLAFLQYTSGSTAAPKGVMVTHGNLLHTLDDLDRGWEHTPDSVMVTWLPIFHDLGLIYGALIPLFKGFRCVMLPPPAFLQRPVRWLEAIARYRGTHSAAPNFAYDLCVAGTTAEQRAALDLRSWRLTLNAAEPVRAATIAAFNAAFAPSGLSPLTVKPGYGLAEATLKVCSVTCAEPVTVLHVRSDELARHRVVPAAPDDRDGQPLVGCGWGQLDNRRLIVNPETRQPCAEDEVGEIWFAGRSVAQGYWQRPEVTAETFQATLANGTGPFLRTGDLGFVKGRELYVTGRVKDLIIVRGLNHYPQDIELTVEKCHPALRPACGAAFSVETDGREALVIAQEVERTFLRKLPLEEVVAAIRQSVIEQHELPVAAIVLLRTGSIPKTSSGKIMRRACRQQYLQGKLEIVAEWKLPAGASEAAPAQAGQPAAVVECAVIATWLTEQLARRLHLEARQFDPREPFSRYGLDSLTAVELSGALERWLGRRLPPTLIYDYPSIQALAAQLAVMVGTRDPGPVVGLPAVQPVPATEREPIAVIGVGGRFPGAESVADFWELLAAGRDAITRVPPGRWDPAAVDAPAWGGFLADVEGFDAAFFGVAPREADLMDPQQRLLLEVAYAALEDAGIAPKALAGTRTGVFVGISTNDYGRLLARVAAGTDAHAGTGNALSIAANRISYLLDLRGPSLAIDTACSSSLVALHQAVRSLRAGESDAALVGGVNLILAPELTTTFARAGMLAPDGRCKTFDASANGYVRGEGCGVVVLKRWSDARRDGDRVLALVRGSAVNQDGRSNGLTAPNGPAQQAVVRAALRDAGVAPAQVGYVEAHGTGTSLGDPIEFNSLREVLLEGRAAETPCRIGSLKTNIGHLEAAAGIAGLIKVVLSLRHGLVPPHLHLRTVNPLIQLDGTSLSIPGAAVPWTGPDRVAGVSSFGFGGTNAHVVLSATDEPAAPARAAPPEHVLVLSARTEPALRALAARYAARVGSADTGTWADLCHAAATQRGTYSQRLLLTGRDSAPLAAFAAGAPTSGVLACTVEEPPKVALLFPAESGATAAVRQELFATVPAFRAAVEECDRLLRDAGTPGVLSAFASGQATGAAGVAVEVALQYGLARMWQAWGVEPGAVFGAGAGEFAAAVVAGALTLRDALAGRVSARAPTQFSSGADRDPLLLITESAGGVVGEAELGALGQAGDAGATERRVGYARAVAAAKGDLCIELGGGGLLAQAAPVEAGGALASLATGRTAREALVHAAARAQVRGVPIRWNEVDRGWPFRHVDLPLYPFQRQRHWFDGAPQRAGGPADVERWIEPLERDPTLSPTERSAVRGILSALQRLQTPGGADGCTYEIHWCPTPLAPAAATRAGRWLVIGPTPAGLRDALSARNVAWVQSAEFVDGEWTAVILWTGSRGTDQLLRTAQVATAPFWIVSRRGVAVDDNEARDLDLEQAAGWGFGKVLALEHPDRWGGLIDVPPEPDRTVLNALVDEVLAATDEDQVALRSGQRFVARLRRSVGRAAATKPIRSDGVYWIVGGTGALGLHVATWLVGRGATKLVLSARHGPSSGAQAAIDQLRARGAVVQTVAADVADPADVHRVLAVAAGLGPLRGVVHAAGVVGRDSIATLSPGKLSEVLRAKLAGARVLEETLAGVELDLLVVCSSIAAVWGAKGQAHYAAANAALDAFARRCRAHARPALSVNWGPWTGGGMAGRDEQSVLASYGIASLEPAEALRLLDEALAGDRAQVVCARVDWTRFKEFYELRGPKPFLSELRGAEQPAEQPGPAAEIVALGAAPMETRAARLEAWLQHQVGAVLGFRDGRVPDVRQGFFALGMDSMMAVDLGQRLSRACGRTLPSTLVFDHANIQLLAAHLAETVLGWGAAAPPSQPAVAAEPPASTAATPEGGAADELAGRLARLESLLRQS